MSTVEVLRLHVYEAVSFVEFFFYLIVSQARTSLTPGTIAAHILYIKNAFLPGDVSFGGFCRDVYIRESGSYSPASLGLGHLIGIPSLGLNAFHISWHTSNVLEHSVPQYLQLGKPHKAHSK